MNSLVKKYSGWIAAAKLLAPIAALWAAYAFLRYVVAGPVDPAGQPLYLVNKMISMTALSMIAASYILSTFGRLNPKFPRRKLAVKKQLGLGGFYLAAVHVILSFKLLGPERYGFIFGPDGSITAHTILTIAFGAAAFLVFILPAYGSIPEVARDWGPKKWKKAQHTGYAAMALIAGHVFLMGYHKWPEPGTWHGNMPPLTMLAFVIAMGVLAYRAFWLIRR